MPSQPTVLATSTASPSPALKNTSSKNNLKRWAHDRGLECEARVIRYYQRKSYVLFKQRFRTPFAEIDLLLRTPEGHLLMVEVKSATSEAFLPYRISQRQKWKQQQALLYLSEQFRCSVEAHWAFVMESGEILVLEDISGC